VCVCVFFKLYAFILLTSTLVLCIYFFWIFGYLDITVTGDS